MRHEYDPLEAWLDWSTWTRRVGRGPRLNHTRAALTRLHDELGPPAEGATRSSGELSLDIPSDVVLTRKDLPLAETVYMRAVERGGPGNTHTQRKLLDLMGWTARPESVPFWIDLLELRRRRDSFSRTRQTYALAALSFLVIRDSTPAAVDALLQATHQGIPALRAQALRHLVAAFAQADRPVPPEVIARMEQMAKTETTFLPRHVARRCLHQQGLAVPVDNPDGSLVLSATHQRDGGVSLTVEVASRDSLSTLNAVIQKGLAWDDDHLYVFMMTNNRQDEYFNFKRLYEDSSPPFAGDMSLGQMGLVRGQRFQYLFDFGDKHLFQVVVKEIRATAPIDALPRVLDGPKTMRPQYPMW